MVNRRVRVLLSKSVSTSGLLSTVDDAINAEDRGGWFGSGDRIRCPKVDTTLRSALQPLSARAF